MDDIGKKTIQNEHSVFINNHLYIFVLDISTSRFGIEININK